MIKGQSKWASFLEANVNTFVGFTLTMLFSPLFYWIVGITYTFNQLWLVTLLFTILSIVRGYVIRRWFNKKEENKDANLLEQIETRKDIFRSIPIEDTERYQALKLIHGYKEELEAAKHQYRAWIADAIESGYLTLDYFGDSNKQNIENGN